MSATDRMVLLANIYIAAWTQRETAFLIAGACLLLAVAFAFMGRGSDER